MNSIAKFGPETARVEHVVIINDDSIESGGAAHIMLASMRLLRQRGIKVTLLTGDDGNNEELAGLGVDVVALKGMHILDGNRISAAVRGLYSVKARHFLEDWIERHDTSGTIYHLHNWHKLLSPSAFVPLRRVAQRLFITTHDFFLTCPNGGYYNYRRNEGCELTPMGFSCLISACDKRHYAHKLWRVARQLVRASLFQFADTPATVVVVHDGMIPYLERGGVPRQSIKVLRNPVIPWLPRRVEAEHNHKVLFVGRLEADKGIDLLCEACELIGASLTVVGDGPLRAGLEERYPHAEFLGRLTKPQIANVVDDIRVVVVPTRGRETFGLVVLEALMCGIPVIVSEHAMIVDEVVGNETGLSCKTVDAKMLAAPIAQLREDDEAVAAMSEKAFREASMMAPTPEQWCDHLIDLYKQKLT